MIRLGALLSLDTEVVENGQNSNKLTQQTIDWFRYTHSILYSCTSLLIGSGKHTVYFIPVLPY